MKITKCLAYIWPAEDIQGKDIALANVKFITGPYERKTKRYSFRQELLERLGLTNE